jgi:hypothetical protein
LSSLLPSFDEFSDGLLPPARPATDPNGLRELAARDDTFNRARNDAEIFSDLLFG